MELPFYLSYAALWVLVVFETLVVIGLVKAHGHRHPEHVSEQNHADEPAPEFEATDIAGAPAGTSSLRGQRAALLFVSPDCETCSASPVQLEALKAKTRAKVVVVCRADRERCAAAAAGYDADVQVIADEDRAISELFRITATPTAITLTEDGRVASRGYALSGTDRAQGNGHVEPSDVSEMVIVGENGLVGTDVPAFEAEDVRGQAFSSSALGRGAALLFTSPDCAGCEVTLSELETLRAASHGELVVVCHSPSDRCASLAHYYQQRVRVIADPDRVLHELFGVTSLPILVSIGQDGRIGAVGRPSLAGDQAPEVGDERLQRLVNEMRGGSALR